MSLLLNTWSAFVVNRNSLHQRSCLRFFVLELKQFILVCMIFGEFQPFCSPGLRYLGWDTSKLPSSFTTLRGFVTWYFPYYMYPKLLPHFVCWSQLTLHEWPRVYLYAITKHMWIVACISSKTTDAYLTYSEHCPGWGPLRRQPRSTDLGPVSI